MGVILSGVVCAGVFFAAFIFWVFVPIFRGSELRRTKQNVLKEITK